MRKQTKLVAVLSTAALLAIGASMTSFAATGWVEENGTWVYYDRDEERATEEWKKSGDNWFWLDENGEMAVDQLIEDDDDYYYVNESGAMVTNQWVAIENEDAGEEDEPDYYWYYFQANGKAYKRSDSASESSISAKTINGKKYAFDEEGRMFYGWVSDGERQTDDDAWRDSDYYFGDENDGAMAQGWVQISIVDDEYEDDLQPGDEYWDEDQDRWFYFQTSGKKVRADNDGELEEKTINGQKYGFDYEGRMIASWFSEDVESGSTSTASEDSTASTAEVAEFTRGFKYFSDPEDGARYTRGWFKVVPGYYLEEDEYNDGDDYWYYADGNGELYANEIKTIKGKKYAFNENGRMLDGLVLLEMEAKSNSSSNSFSSTDIAQKYDDDDSVYNYETEDDFDDLVMNYSQLFTSGQLRFYYFGDEDDGAMKDGKETVELDGENLSFKFKDSSSSKGAGIHGEDDDKLYAAGKLIEADSDDKYQVVLYIENKGSNGVDDVANDLKLIELDAEEFLDYCVEITEENASEYGMEFDEDETTWVLDLTDEKKAEIAGEYGIETLGDEAVVEFNLVNTSGSMVKNKSAAKDGEDYEFDVDSYEIQSVTIEN